MACLVYMVKKFEILRIHREEWKVDGHMMMVLCGMGVPMGLQYSITAIGSVILQTAANTLGSAAVAAMTAGGKIGNFLACPFDAMGSLWQPTVDRTWEPVNWTVLARDLNPVYCWGQDTL